MPLPNYTTGWEPDCPAKRAALRRICCMFAGAGERWAALAERGATNEQIVELLNYEFGYGGGSSALDWVPVWGIGNPPRVWFDIIARGTPALSGQNLIRQVRLLFDIHHPTPKDQLSLFGREEQP